MTSYDVLVGQLPLAKAIMPTKVPNLYITAGDARLSGVEGELMGEAQPQFFLRKAHRAIPRRNRRSASSTC